MSHLIIYIAVDTYASIKVYFPAESPTFPRFPANLPRFFLTISQEDFATVLTQIDVALKTIEIYNNHFKAYHEELNPRWTDEKAELELGIKRLNTYPPMVSDHVMSVKMTCLTCGCIIDMFLLVRCV